MTDWHSSYRQDIETELKAFLEHVSALGSLNEPEIKLAEAVSYSVTGSGKRIRPLLGLLAFETVSPLATPEKRRQAIHCLLSVEFLHCSSLIHDDLPAIDDDELRRGKPTVWKKFGEDTAILAGNVLNFLAFEVLAKHSPPEMLPEAVTLLAETAGIHGLNGGQMRDLSPDMARDLGWIKETHRKKTAQLIRASVLLGGILGKADLETKNLLAEYADAMGLAFQIKDDLLDATGSESAVGKKLQKDSGQKGIVHFLGIQKSSAELNRLTDSAIRISKSLKSKKLEELAIYITARDH